MKNFSCDGSNLNVSGNLQNIFSTRLDFAILFSYKEHSFQLIAFDLCLHQKEKRKKDPNV